jgi:hypothetical protein
MGWSDENPPTHPKGKWQHRIVKCTSDPVMADRF